VIERVATTAGPPVGDSDGSLSGGALAPDLALVVAVARRRLDDGLVAEYRGWVAAEEPATVGERFEEGLDLLATRKCVCVCVCVCVFVCVTRVCWRASADARPCLPPGSHATGVAPVTRLGAASAAARGLLRSLTGLGEGEEEGGRDRRALYPDIRVRGTCGGACCDAGGCCCCCFCCCFCCCCCCCCRRRHRRALPAY
jgi:hypothetical protein